MRPLFLVFCLAALAPAGKLTANRTGDAKKKLLRARGGSAATEKAVAKALAWLAAHQSEQGHWDADGFMDVHGCACTGKGGGWHGERVPCGFDIEVTALATLAFLGAGHTHKQEGAFRDNVARALDVLKTRPARTLFGIAYATQAMAEAFDMTGDDTLRAAVDRGIATLVGSRQQDGGWRYFPRGGMPSGTPTTTAVVAALRAAEDAGFKVRSDYREPVLKLLDELTDWETGRVKYTLDAHRLGYTPTTTNAASATWVRLLLGVAPTHRRIQSGVKAMAKRKPKWKIKFKRMKVKGVTRDVQIGYLQHYYWWHGSEALARIGGSTWKSWNAALKSALLPKQVKSGHAAGSWDPAGTYGKVAGRVFSTALCALMLESYYRAP